MAGEPGGILTVACVLQVPANRRCDYDAGYVAALRNSVTRHLPREHRFVCLSNVDVPCERIPLVTNLQGWWAKIELFRPDIEADRILFYDLDTVIVGDQSDIASVEEFTMIEGFRHNPDRKRRGSGLMMLPPSRREVWDAWTRNPIMTAHGDQGFISPFSKQTWQRVTPGQVVSYKHDCRPTESAPEDARVICFHGKPRPAQLPSDHWIREHWR